MGRLDGRTPPPLSTKQKPVAVLVPLRVPFLSIPFHSILHTHAQGRVCIIEIDVQGAQSVKKATAAAAEMKSPVAETGSGSGNGLDINPRYIFIEPPSMEELERRLRGRGTETEDQV